MADNHVITAAGVALLEFTDLILDYLDVYTEDDNQGDFRNDFTPNWKCKIL
ncbi:MAG: hypothetical protein ACTSVZ_03805 [Promethearchaeota archaeon]